MVFSPIPAYLDPSSFHQQQNCQIFGGSGTNQLLISQAGAAPPLPPPVVGGIRPGSMAERARMANIPMPEAALKCPRCESTNTKFCYFNNYSLSQPRHFCKACRRYWTRGGALRNVPVGGGCRRNKRSKSSSSKSPASTNTSSASTNTSSAAVLGLNQSLPPLRFMSPLGNLTDTFTGDMGLTYTGISSPVVDGSNEMNFHSGGGGLGVGLGGASLFPGDGGSGTSAAHSIESWRLSQLQPFSFLGGGFESSPSPGIYHFHGGESSFIGCERSKLQTPAITQISSVKMEEKAAAAQLNPSRQMIAGIHGTDQWNAGTAAWNDFSGFSASSTTNPL